MLRLLASIPLLVLLACESNEAKISRLNTEQAIASLLYQAYERKADSVVHLEKGYGPKSAAYGDSLVKAKNRLDLANRELNKFMSGR